MPPRLPRLRIRASMVLTTAVQAACLKAAANITAQVAAAWKTGSLTTSSSSSAASAALDWGRVAEFSFYGFVSAALGFPWQYTLEYLFPTQVGGRGDGGDYGSRRGASQGGGIFRGPGGGSAGGGGGGLCPRRRNSAPHQHASQQRLHDGHDPDAPAEIPLVHISPASPTLPVPAVASTATATAGGGISWRNVGYKMVLDQTLWLTITTTIFLVCTNALRVATLSVLLQIWREKAWFIIKAAWHVWPLVAICNFAFVPVDYRVLVASVVGFAWNVFLSLISLTTTPTT